MNINFKILSFIYSLMWVIFFTIICMFNTTIESPVDLIYNIILIKIRPKYDLMVQNIKDAEIWEKMMEKEL